MGNGRVVTTDRSGLSLAQVGGNDVYKLLHQVQSVIELGNLGDEYVRMFAEPVDNGRNIDWYVEAGENAVPLSSLDDAQRKALLGRFSEMISKLQEYSGSLRQNPSQTYRTYADILEKALIVPDLESSLYSLDGNPLLTNWGFSAGDNEIVDGAQALMKDIQEKLEKIKDVSDKLDEMDKKIDEAPQPLQPSEEPVQEEAKPAEEQAEAPQEPELPDDVKKLLEETPEQEPVQPQSPPAPKPQSGSWIAAAITGAALLAAGAVAAWYFLGQTPDSDEQEEKPSLAWLKGDFNAKGVLIDENDEAVDLTLHFEGEDGIGTSEIKSEKQTCKGKVVATQQADNRVAFSLGALQCPNGKNYEPFTMTCRRGQNECIGTNKNGESWNLKVDF